MHVYRWIDRYADNTKENAETCQVVNSREAHGQYIVLSHNLSNMALFKEMNFALFLSETAQRLSLSLVLYGVAGSFVLVSSTPLHSVKTLRFEH